MAMDAASPQSFDRVLSSMCTEPHPAARAAAEAFLATNPGDPETYETVAELERQVVEGLAEIAAAPEPLGYVTSGGTESNLQAIRVARERSEARTPNVVAPASVHFSVQKATSILGLDLRTVPVDGDRRADPARMAAAADGDTAAIVGVAGTTEYGRVDPIPALGDIARENGALLHVDAAWGGFLLPFTDWAWNFADAAVDTLTVDPHKAGRAVIPAGGLLVAEGASIDALAVATPYLESGAQASLTGTRSGAGVASAAAALDALWPDGYREAYETAAATASWLTAAFRDRGYAVVEPELPLVAVDLPAPVFDRLRERGWRLARTEAGETRIVCMPHVTRSMLESFLADLDRIRADIEA
jgi:tyrosine decarboxylase/aspartate 1-decarboxylase